MLTNARSVLFPWNNHIGSDLLDKIYVLIRVARDSLEAVVDQISKLDGTDSVDVVTGTYDMIVTLTGDNVAKMLSQVVNDIRKVDGIVYTETLIALKID